MSENDLDLLFQQQIENASPQATQVKDKLEQQKTPLDEYQLSELLEAYRIDIRSTRTTDILTVIQKHFPNVTMPENFDTARFLNMLDEERRAYVDARQHGPEDAAGTNDAFFKHREREQKEHEREEKEDEKVKELDMDLVRAKKKKENSNE